MNILLLNSQKNNKYLNELKRILKSNKIDKLEIYRGRLNIKIVKKLNIDVIISFHYKYVIPVSILKLVNYRAFNFHNSYLPLNRGMHPILWSAVSNKFASSLHKIDKTIDNGDLVFRKEIKINNNETLFYAYRLLEEISLRLFKKIWKKLRKKILYNQNISLIKQNKNKISYNNNLKSKILLSFLPKKWMSKIKDVQINHKMIFELLKQVENY